MDLRAAWAALAGVGAVATGAGLLRSWAEPHRRYHGRAHLAAVLAHLDTLDPDGPVATGTAPGRLARLAAWYHDVVYLPGAPGNEQASAARAVAELAPLVGADPAAEVARLVMVTVDHRPAAGDTAAALLCDADLAVLGSDAAGYGAYVAAVRAEYGALDEATWRTGRSAVLADLLGRPALFATAAGRDRWEAAARANLAAELAVLAP